MWEDRGRCPKNRVDTHARQNILLIQTQSGTEQNRTEEDLGAKLQHRNPMRAHKKIPKKESTQYFLQVFYFYQVGKASETQVGHL